MIITSSLRMSWKPSDVAFRVLCKANTAADRLKRQSLCPGTVVVGIYKQ